MDDVVSASECEALLDLLEACWSSAVRKLEGSDVETLRGMLEQIRGEGVDLVERARVFHENVLADLSLYSHGNAGMQAMLGVAFWYVAALKVEVERGAVSRNSDLAEKALHFAKDAHDHILGKGRDERLARAKKGGLKRAEVLYSGDKELVLQLLRERQGGWMSMSEALEWIDKHFRPVSASALGYDSRLETLARWIKKDTRFQEAYEEGMRSSK